MKIWFWIAMAEGVAIVVLLWLLLKKRLQPKDREIRKKVMGEGKIDFANTMMSAFHAQALYDQLKVKCHPDRFPQDGEKNAIALELFQQIAKNKNNYNKLLELKVLAEEKLNINL